MSNSEDKGKRPIGGISGVTVGGIVAIVSIIVGFELNDEYGASAGPWWGGTIGIIIGAVVGGIWGGKDKWHLGDSVLYQNKCTTLSNWSQQVRVTVGKMPS